VNLGRSSGTRAHYLLVIAMIANTPERTRTADDKQSEAHSFGVASRVQSLDGLRAVSITLVITGHLIFSLPTTHPLPRYLSFTFGRGNTGVVIFFGISGYIITNLLLCFPLNILIPFLLAECSFHIMERPLREWGRMRIRRPCK
jgi:peptidoglycan/LPS O-acetylase OafA/YrhL